MPPFDDFMWRSYVATGPLLIDPEGDRLRTVLDLTVTAADREGGTIAGQVWFEPCDLP